MVCLMSPILIVDCLFLFFLVYDLLNYCPSICFMPNQKRAISLISFWTYLTKTPAAYSSNVARGVCFSKLTKTTLTIILTSTFGDKTASWSGKLLSSVSNKNGFWPKRSFSVVIWKLDSFDFHVKNSDLDFLPNLACNLNRNSGNLWISNTIQWASNLSSSLFGNTL